MKIQLAEIFRSIQGESTFAGKPCTFIRTAGCNFNCSYCDSSYAKTPSFELEPSQIIQKVQDISPAGLVEITGGEPLLQPLVPLLASRLNSAGYKVLMETNGSFDCSVLDPQIVKIIDVKCPSSGQSKKTHWPNLEKITKNDQVKFVLGNREDYDWAKDVIANYGLQQRATVLLSIVWDALSLKELADWVLKDNLNAAIQPQLHKIIWGSDTRL